MFGIKVLNGSFGHLIRLCKVIECVRFSVPVLVLFVVADKRAVLFAKGNHVDVPVFFGVMEGVYDIVFGTFFKPCNYLLNELT